MNTLDQEIQTIRELTANICRRMDNIIAQETRISDHLRTQLEYSCWKIACQISDIESTRERFG